MPLNPTSFSDAMFSSMVDRLGVDEVTHKGKNDVTPNPVGFPVEWASAYKDYSMEGFVRGATNQGGDISPLVACFTTNESISVRDLAIAFSRYWATVALIPGPPGWGNGPITVSNNAAGLVGLFEAAIVASLGSESSTPWYFEFISNLENIAVKKIIWTVTERSGPSTVTNTTGIV